MMFPFFVFNDGRNVFRRSEKLVVVEFKADATRVDLFLPFLW